jgi:hypothetical protein
MAPVTGKTRIDTAALFSAVLSPPSFATTEEGPGYEKSRFCAAQHTPASAVDKGVGSAVHGVYRQFLKDAGITLISKRFPVGPANAKRSSKMQTKQAPARTARFKEIGRELRQALLLAEELQGLCAKDPQCDAFVEVSNEVDEVVAGLARDYALAIRQYREQILSELAEKTRECHGRLAHQAHIGARQSQHVSRKPTFL